MKKIYLLLSSILITTAAVQAQYMPNTGPSISLGTSAPDVHRSFFYEFAGSGDDMFIFSHVDDPTGNLIYSWDYQGSGAFTGSINFGNVGAYSAVVGDPTSNTPFSLQFYKSGNDVFVNAFEFIPPNTMNPLIVGQYITSAPGLTSTIETDVDHMGNVVVLLDDRHLTTTDFFLTGSLTFTPVVDVFSSSVCTSSQGSIVDVSLGTENGGGASTVSLSTNINGGLVSVLQVPFTDVASGGIGSCTNISAIDVSGATLPVSNYTAGPIAARWDINSPSDHFSILIHTNGYTGNLYVNTLGWGGFVPNDAVDVHNQNSCFNSGLTYHSDIVYSQDLVHVFFQGTDCNGYFNGGTNGLRRTYFHDGSSPSLDYAVLNSASEDVYIEINANSRHSSLNAAFIGTSYIDANSGFDAKYRISNQASPQLRKKSIAESVEDKADLTVFPNPVIQNVNISGNDLGDYSQLSVRDIIGKTVMSLNMNGQNNQTIDLSTLEKGVYTISLTGINGEQVNKRIIKQ